MCKHLIGMLLWPLIGCCWESCHKLNFCSPLHWWSLGRGWACDLGCRFVRGITWRCWSCWGVIWKLYSCWGSSLETGARLRYSLRGNLETNARYQPVSLPEFKLKVRFSKMESEFKSFGISKAPFQVNTSSEGSVPLPCQTPPSALTL